MGVGGDGKSELGLYGVVGGMTVIVMLAYAMRLLRIFPETVDRAENRVLCRVWKCGGYECKANIYSETYTEGFVPLGPKVVTSARASDILSEVRKKN